MTIDRTIAWPSMCAAAKTTADEWLYFIRSGKEKVTDDPEADKRKTKLLARAARRAERERAAARAE